MKWLNPFSRTYSRSELEQMHFLMLSPLFSTLKESEVYDFLPFLYQRKYVSGEAIFFRGDPAQAIYFVLKGTVQLSLDVDNKFEELSRLNRGQFFGENALLPGTERIYNAICHSDSCLLYVLPAISLQEILVKDRKIRAKVYLALAEYYNGFISNLFRNYRESFGFFDLSKAYERR
jgi:CRP-like cAMP-binding protein